MTKLELHSCSCKIVFIQGYPSRPIIKYREIVEIKNYLACKNFIFSTVQGKLANFAHTNDLNVYIFVDLKAGTISMLPLGRSVWLEAVTRVFLFPHPTE